MSRSELLVEVRMIGKSPGQIDQDGVLMNRQRSQEFLEWTVDVDGRIDDDGVQRRPVRLRRLLLHEKLPNSAAFGSRNAASYCVKVEFRCGADGDFAMYV